MGDGRPVLVSPRKWLNIPVAGTASSHPSKKTKCILSVLVIIVFMVVCGMEPHGDPLNILKMRRETVHLILPRGGTMSGFSNQKIVTVGLRSRNEHIQQGHGTQA